MASLELPTIQSEAWDPDISRQVGQEGQGATTGRSPGICVCVAKSVLRLALWLKALWDYLWYKFQVKDTEELIVDMPVFAPPKDGADVKRMRQLIAEDVPFLIQWPTHQPLLPEEVCTETESYLSKALQLCHSWVPLLQFSGCVNPKRKRI